MSRQASLALLLTVSLALPLLADDGDLDATFWGDGMLALASSRDLLFGGLVSNPEGQLAVLYSYIPASAAIETVAWRTVGDSALGDACVVDPDPGSNRHWTADLGFDAFGRLLVLTCEVTLVGNEQSYFVSAYSFPDCELDASFGGDGIVQLSNWTFVTYTTYSRLRPLADGRILVAGKKYGSPTYCRVDIIILRADGSVEAELCAPGSLWPSQDVTGKDAVVAPNGHIVAIAQFRDFIVVDVLPNGTVAGVVTVPFDLGGGDVDNPTHLVATENGKVVVVGNAERDAPVDNAAVMAVLHWNAQGVLELDSSFSGDGKLILTFAGRTTNSLEYVAAQGDGKLVVTGHAGDPGYDLDMAVARLLPDGSFDPDFYSPGSGARIVAFDEGSPNNDGAYRVDLQNGRVVLGGTVDIANDISSVGVARLLNSYVFADGFEAPQAPGWLWVD